MKFLTAMKYSIILQQILLISPFRVVNNRVEPSALLPAYFIISVCGFIFNVLVAISWIRADGSLQLLHFENGYLWGIIVTFELAFAAISFPVLVIHTLVTRSHHINFLNKISDIDECIELLGVDAGRVNYAKRWRSLFFTLLSSAYFSTLWYLVFFHVLPPSYLAKKGIILLLFANQSEQGSMGLLTLTIINHCTFIRMRFEMLQYVNVEKILAMQDVKKSRILLANWLTIFRDLCQLIEKINRGWGFVIAWRYSHDFTLLISQLYLMYLVAEQGGHMLVCAFIAYWSIQNIVKMLGLALSASAAARKAYECGALVNRLNTPGIDIVAKQMLDSFGVWMFHRKIQFTANNLFSVDLTLVYAVFGALASYLLILIQFKQQEESQSMLLKSVNESIFNETSRIN